MRIGVGFMWKSVSGLRSRKVEDHLGALARRAVKAEIGTQFLGSFAKPHESEVTSFQGARCALEATAIIFHPECDFVRSETKSDFDVLSFRMFYGVGDGL